MTYLPVLLGFSVLFSLSASSIIGEGFSLIVGAVCLGLSLILLLFKRVRKAAVYSIVLASAGASLCYYSVYFQNTVDLVKKYADSDCFIECTVENFPEEKYGKYYYIAKNVKINDEEVYGKVKISSYMNLGADMGDTLIGDFYCADFHSNKEYYYSKGIFISATVRDINNIRVEKNDKKPLMFYPGYIRGKIRDSISTYIPKQEAAFLCGILTGDKSAISGELNSDFRKTGLSHWLSVSGLHLSVLSLFLRSILNVFKAKKIFKASITCVVLIFFSAVTGFPLSVIRSLIMNLLILFADLFYKKADSLNSLGIAVLFISIFSPFVHYDIGFLLSIFATLGVILFSPKIENRIKKRLPEFKGSFTKKTIDYLVSSLSCSLSALVSLLPFSIYYFGTVSLLSPLANIIFIFPFTILFVASAVLAIVFYIPYSGVISRALSFGIAFATKFVLSVVSRLADFPYASISAYSNYIKIWFVISLALVSLSVLIYKKKAFKISAVVSLVLFIVAFSVQSAINNKSVQVVVVDCGNSLSVIVSDKYGKTVIGTDGYYTDETLSAMCISKLDSVTMLGNGYRDFSGALELCKEFSVRDLKFSETYVDGNIEKKAHEYKASDNIFKTKKYTAKFTQAQSGNYSVLKVGDVSFLIISGNADLSKLSGYYDYLITSKVPINYGNIKFSCVIISCYSGKAEGIAKRFDNTATKYIATQGKGDIIIEITGGKERIRRGYNG